MWLPEGPPRAVLFLYDGQNVFARRRRARPTWRADETAARLITTGAIPPLAIVGIETRDPDRWRDLLPYPDPHNVSAREFAADRFADFVVRMAIPCVRRAFPRIEDVERLAIGGSSYGALGALHAALRHPGTFDGLLLESPPLWVGKGRLVADALGVSRLAGRIFIGVGTRESRRDDASAELVSLARAFARHLRARAAVRLRIVEAARHHEAAWAERLPEALRWLFADDGRAGGTKWR